MRKGVSLTKPCNSEGAHAERQQVKVIEVLANE